jgi:hypothetical protein
MELREIAMNALIEHFDMVSGTAEYDGQSIAVFDDGVAVTTRHKVLAGMTITLNGDCGSASRSGLHMIREVDYSLGELYRFMV